MGKVCQICGANSGIYPLCTTHLQEKKLGNVVKCSECGLWHLTNELCSCQQNKYTELPSEGFNECVVCGKNTRGYAFCRNCFHKFTEEEMLGILNNEIDIDDLEEDDSSDDAEIEDNVLSSYKATNNNENNNIVIIDAKSTSKCITCGRETSGMLFCSSCYSKYKAKELLFRITNCVNVELLDENYEGRYTCKDGHIVKSKSERDIDNYLFEHGISHAYERELYYGATEKEVLHPDFYLPNYLGDGEHVYIEHWGYNENNIHYTNTKKFKMPIYEKLGITLVCTYEKTDMGRIDTILERKLNKDFIEKNKINFAEETAHFSPSDNFPF